jgi:hypothetical protein
MSSWPFMVKWKVLYGRDHQEQRLNRDAQSCWIQSIKKNLWYHFSSFLYTFSLMYTPALLFSIRISKLVWNYEIKTGVFCLQKKIKAFFFCLWKPYTSCISKYCMSYTFHTFLYGIHYLKNVQYSYNSWHFPPIPLVF